jgi:hypothetical protein
MAESSDRITNGTSDKKVDSYDNRHVEDGLYRYENRLEQL